MLLRVILAFFKVQFLQLEHFFELLNLLEFGLGGPLLFAALKKTLKYFNLAIQHITFFNIVPFLLSNLYQLLHQLFKKLLLDFHSSHIQQEEKRK